MKNQRGSGSVLWAGVVAVALVTIFFVTVALSHVVTTHRLRATADAAALAAAASTTTDPCQVARRVAADNNVTLASCRRVGDQVEFVVSVTVSAQVPWFNGKRTIVAGAHAGSLAQQ